MSGGNGGIDWDPRRSTLAKAMGGDYAGAGNDVASRTLDVSRRMNQLVLNPGATVSEFQQEQAAGQAQREAEARRPQELAAQQQAAQQAQDQAAARERAAAEQANQQYIQGQGKLQAESDSMDAFQRARQAARKAKGRSLFGAWG